MGSRTSWAHAKMDNMFFIYLVQVHFVCVHVQLQRTILEKDYRTRLFDHLPITIV